MVDPERGPRGGYLADPGAPHAAGQPASTRPWIPPPVNYPAFDPLSPVTPLQADELQALEQSLLALPADGVMSLDGLDGYLSALAAGPTRLLAELPTVAWLPVVWGGDGDDGGASPAAPFASKRQRKDTVVRVLRHLRHLAHQLQAAPDEWQPIFSIAEQGAIEWVDASDWCRGFLAAVDLLPQAWAPLWDDAELGPLLAPLLRLGGGLDPDAVPADDALLDDPAAVDAASRALPEAVLALHARCRAA